MCEFQVDDGCYFQDGHRCVDFVIVLKGDSLDPLVTYIKNLEEMGVEFEVAKGQIIRKSFLLIHLPHRAMKHYSEAYNVGTEERRTFLREPPLFTYSYSTPISYVPNKQKGTFTNTERITVINKLLETASYGEGPNQKGLSKLIRVNLVEDAYPLHDGPIDNDILEYTNDRQMLFHYWSNLGVWYKEMPLDMIKKYFGCEIAFYFAWLEFFNYMLIPAAIIGTFVTFFNMTVLVNFYIVPLGEVCDANNIMVCPTCEFGKYCKFETLASFCTLFKLSYIFDNYLTVGFAVFMSAWTIFFIKRWKRKENSLRFRWEVEHLSSTLDYRQGLRDSTKVHVITRQEEKSVPKYITILLITVTVIFNLFVIFLALAGFIGIIVYELTISAVMDTTQAFFLKQGGRLVALVAGSLTQMVFIQLFSLIYRKLCTLLAKFGNPRTHQDFGNSFVYKRYLISFVNNYAIFFYIAFVKGRFFTVPNRFGKFAIFQKQTCQPLSCMLGLCIMLLFFLLLKRLAENTLAFLIPNCKSGFQKLTSRNVSKMTQYEEEYTLSTDRFLLINRFCDMVTAYGLVTFFVAALPLAPMCILLNNLLDVRLHAYQLVVRYRRPVPKKTGGIGGWNGIILGLTYLSTAVNAFVLAFTSNFVELYQYNANAQLKGYINSTFSAFSVKDSAQLTDLKSYPDICYYRAKRYPPDHRKRYQLTKEYWVEVTWRLFFVFVFEHVVMLCHGFVSYVMSDIPKDIRRQKIIDKQLAKEARIQFAEKHLKISPKDEGRLPTTSGKKKV